jgi:hypothetical protein
LSSCLSHSIDILKSFSSAPACQRRRLPISPPLMCRPRPAVTRCRSSLRRRYTNPRQTHSSHPLPWRGAAATTTHEISHADATLALPNTASKSIVHP